MNVRRSLTAAAIVVASGVLSSCGVGFGAQTDQVYNPSRGVDDRSGSVDVLNALVVSGTDGSGTVIATLVNNDQVNDDSLRRIAGSGKDASLRLTPGGATTIPSGGLLNLANEAPIAVRGARVVPGNLVRLTYTFDRGEAVTVNAPVVSAKNPVYSKVRLPPAS